MKRSALSELMDSIKARLSILEANVRRANFGEVTLTVSEGKQPRVYVRDASGRHSLRKSEWKRIAAPILRREYERKLLAADRKRLKLLVQYAAIQTDEEILDSFSGMRRELMGKYSLISDEEVEKWLNRPRITAWQRMGEHPYRTNRGDWVRSKSEVIIANRLFELGIPYIYEFPIKIGRQFRFPDFTVLNRRTGEEFIFEHLGMLDDPDYIDDNLTKIKEYKSIGIELGRNLVVTCETKRHQLDMKELDRVIEKNFL